MLSGVFSHVISPPTNITFTGALLNCVRVYEYHSISCTLHSVPLPLNSPVPLVPISLLSFFLSPNSLPSTFMSYMSFGNLPRSDRIV